MVLSLLIPQEHLAYSTTSRQTLADEAVFYLLVEQNNLITSSSAACTTYFIATNIYFTCIEIYKYKHYGVFRKIK